MQLFVTILHVILCLALILIILLQPGKEGAAAFGGGGGNQMYGPRGSGHVLGRATTLVAALFMFTSITLAWYSSERAQSDSDIEEGIDTLDGDEAEGFEISAPGPQPSPEPQPVDPPEQQPDPAAAPGSAIDSLTTQGDEPSGTSQEEDQAP